MTFGFALRTTICPRDLSLKVLFLRHELPTVSTVEHFLQVIILVYGFKKVCFISENGMLVAWKLMHMVAILTDEFDLSWVGQENSFLQALQDL